MLNFGEFGMKMTLDSFSPIKREVKELIAELNRGLISHTSHPTFPLQKNKPRLRFKTNPVDLICTMYNP